jgi:hypothetical protein
MLTRKIKILPLIFTETTDWEDCQNSQNSTPACQEQVFWGFGVAKIGN